MSAFLSVIEFQKRGLPYLHLLVNLCSQNKIKTVNQIDKFRCAEIPYRNIDLILHNIIMKHMIHGPCGDWYIVNGKCSKKYPKDFHEETLIDENDYPTYR